MKKKVSKIPLTGLAVITAIALTLALTACDIDNEEDGVFTSIADFREWLKEQPYNTAETAYNVKLNVSSLSNGSDSVGRVLYDNKDYNKYVNLDLSGSTFTSIGNNAFVTCTNLTGITIPNSVTSIGNDAFAGCTSLTSITIPDNVTTIGNSAFIGCISLTSVTIPNSVTSIGDSAFYDCTSLTSVIIPNKVTTIGKYTFRGSGLTSITIPNNITSIGEYAFEGCTGLTSVTIPNSVTSLGDWAFIPCENLTSVTFQGTITSDNFGSRYYPPFRGDLRAKFYATDPDNGTPGTYTATAPVDAYSVWTKQ